MRLETVLVVVLLASAPYVNGARVPITSYICTQPNGPKQLSPNDNDPCNVSRGLRECSIKESVIPLLLDGVVKSASDTLYAWAVNTNPFVVLDIPQGWCVGSVVMTFQVNIPTLSLSVHTSERLSNNTDRTVFSIVSEAGNTPVVVNFTTLACGRYLRINMTGDQLLYLTEIEVSDTGYEVPPTPVSTPPGTVTTGENSLTHLMPTSVPRDPRAHNTGSTEMGCSAGVSSAVFFAGLLAGAALAGPVGALSVVCYHWKKKQARTRRKDSTTAEDKETAYDSPLQLGKNPAYEAIHK